MNSMIARVVLIDRAKGIQSCVRALGYRLYWHRPPSFNPANYFANPERIFLDTSETNMLCVHKGSADKLVGFEEIT